MSGRIDGGGDAGRESFDFGDAEAAAGSWDTHEPAVGETVDVAPDTEDEAHASPASADDTFGWPDHADGRAHVGEFSCTAADAGDDTGAGHEPVEETRPAPHRVVVGAGQGVLAALRSSGIADPDLPAAYGALVRDGQLQASDFVRGTPVVHAGRRFDLDTRGMDDDAAALGRRLIGTAHRIRVAADVEAVQARTRPTQADRENDPRWQLAQQAQQRERAAVQPMGPQPPAAADESVSGNYDQVVLQPWDSFKK